VAADSGGDGDGVFYLPGGERVEEGLLGRPWTTWSRSMRSWT